MGYDMTIFTTIASASASFVAIIGGFVASKLISINGERSAVNDRITELNETLLLKNASVDEISKYLNTDDALDYIRDHIDALSTNAELADVFETDKPQQLSKEELLPFWRRGLELNEEFCRITGKPCITNEDDVPVELATKTKNNYFDYTVCEMLSKNARCGFWAVSGSLTPKEADIKRYNEKASELEVIQRDIAAIELQIDQLEKQQKSLTKPENMSEGIWIFGAIALFNIFLPLLLTLLLPLLPSWVYHSAQIVCVLFMGIGLFKTLQYMRVLLKWTPSTNADDIRHNVPFATDIDCKSSKATNEV